jgi:hypothetical protein
MLYVIGLGLGDVKDITVKGLEIVKRCDFVYLESYTSILTCGKDEMVNMNAFTSYVLNDYESKFSFFRRNFMRSKSLWPIAILWSKRLTSC